MSVRSEDELLRSMAAVDVGLERIALVYGEHVVLFHEDPVAFGAGQFVLYPQEGSTSRFAIEEQYTGTDWSDPDRLPTSWAWRSETCLPRSDGSYQWVTLEQGEVASADFSQLLERAEGWAKTTQDLAVRELALTADPIMAAGVEWRGGQRTFLT